MDQLTMNMRRVLSIAALLILPCGYLHAADTQPQHRPRYLLRPGDTIELAYRLTPDLNQTVVVQPDGFVDLNVAGELHIAGLTLQQTHDLIVYRDSAELNSPELNLILKDFTRPYVVVAGEVAKPGQIEIRDNMTAMGAILMAGGFTNSAKSGQVLLFRKINDQLAEVKELRLTGIRKTSQLEKDIDLEPGDMILVPHDRISRIQHFLQVTNLGFYMNPADPVP
jgi:polysaccharide biosynthesis/export protein